MRALILLPLLLLPLSAHSATLHVSPEGSGTDGLSWQTAYPTITEAVVASTTGDSIWVKAGVYEEAVEVTWGRTPGPLMFTSCDNQHLFLGGYID